nr:hypothetical protein MFMH1_72180 [Myxococcus sp. MH1]
MTWNNSPKKTLSKRETPLAVWGLVAMCLVAASASAAESREWIAYHPEVDMTAVPYARPAMDRIQNELESVAAGLEDRGVRLRSSGAYGSGFKRYVSVGRDLDFFAIFDLGTVPASLAGAELVMTRMEAVMGDFTARLPQQRDVSLVPLEVVGLSANGQIQNRAKVAVSLASALLNKPSSAPLDATFENKRGQRVPSVFSEGEFPLPARFRSLYNSTLIKYRREMFPGVREASIEIFFSVGITDAQGGTTRKLLFVPIHGGSGVPIRPRDLLFVAAFSSKQSLNGLLELVPASADLVRMRLDLALLLLGVAEDNLRTGELHKGVKRIHQVVDLLGAAMPANERAAVSLALPRWLAAPAATVADDLEKAASVLKESERFFHLSGDAERVLRYYRQRCAALVRSRQAGNWSALVKQLDALAGPAKQDRAEQWASLEKLAARVASEEGPRMADVRHHVEVLRGWLAQAGFRQLPLAGALENEVFVLAEDLKGAGISPEEFERLSYGGFLLRILPEADAKYLLGREPKPPVHRAYMLVTGDVSQNQAFEELHRQLQASVPQR